MIDSTKSPVPTWRKYGTYALLAVLIVAAVYVVWVKELHHSSPSPSVSAPPAAHGTHSSPAAAPKPAAAPSTTVPGGIAISSRNPFAG